MQGRQEVQNRMMSTTPFDVVDTTSVVASCNIVRRARACKGYGKAYDWFARVPLRCVRVTVSVITWRRSIMPHNQWYLLNVVIKFCNVLQIRERLYLR